MSTIHIDMMMNGGMVIKCVESIKVVMERHAIAEAYVYVTDAGDAVVITNNVASAELHHPADLARMVVESELMRTAETTLISTEQQQLPF